jgi:hypothetical protein
MFNPSGSAGDVSVANCHGLNDVITSKAQVES